MTPEEIKGTWKEAASRFYLPTPDEFEQMFRQKKETALERLTAKYKWFSRMSLLMMPCCCGYMLLGDLIGSDLRIWVALIFMLYFATCCVMDYWLYKGVGSISCFTMTVKEVTERAMYYKRKHLLFMAILFPLAFITIGMLIYATGFDKYIMAGVIAGALLGALIGFRHYLDFMAQYRRICD